MPRPSLVTALAAAMLVALAGCTFPGAPAPPGAGEPADHEAPARLGLVGVWRVTADGADPDTWLRVGAGDLAVRAACGVVWGTWAAGETMFIASTYGGHPRCLPVEAPWLDDALAYRGAGDGWELLDATGDVVATLVADGPPPPHPSVPDAGWGPPEITDDVRDALRRAAPLPTGLEPATASRMLGAWAPIGVDRATGAGATFEDGSWSGSDGCNGGGGRWTFESPGAILATWGPSTAIGCPGAPVPDWVAQARRVGFDGDELVLVDLDGAELGRLVRV